jgi:hypothetical protein
MLHSGRTDRRKLIGPLAFAALAVSGIALISTEFADGPNLGHVKIDAATEVDQNGRCLRVLGQIAMGRTPEAQLAAQCRGESGDPDNVDDAARCDLAGMGSDDASASGLVGTGGEAGRGGHSGGGDPVSGGIDWDSGPGGQNGVR